MRRHRKLLRMGCDSRANYLPIANIHNGLCGDSHLYPHVDIRPAGEV